MNVIDRFIEVWEMQHLTQRTIEHLTMFGLALLVASIIGIAVGVIVYRRFRVATVLFNILNIAETIPTLALLVLLLPLLGSA
jgi:osmoprotectant transport system permease protein